VISTFLTHLFIYEQMRGRSGNRSGAKRQEASDRNHTPGTSGRRQP